MTNKLNHMICGLSPCFVSLFQTSVIPQIVLTLGLIGGCALLGLSIAKLGDYCYDRRMAMRDDISNASEYTKNILRQRYEHIYSV